MLGLALALVATVVFATRDNLIRWLAVDTDVKPGVAAAAMLTAGAAVIAMYVLATRTPLRRLEARAFLPGRRR